MPVYPDPVGGVVLPSEVLRSWTTELLGKAETPRHIAEDVAEVLVSADRRGIASHGTARLPDYVPLIEAGVMDPAGDATAIGFVPMSGSFARVGATSGEEFVKLKPIIPSPAARRAYQPAMP